MKKYRVLFCAIFGSAAISIAAAQVASHTPSQFATQARPNSGRVSGKPVARVNGAVLTDVDLQREEFAIFPYARQHNGSIPPEMEPDIRAGAMKMIIFEELVYQEAEKRNLTIPAVQLNKAQVDFRKQFATPQEYQQLLKSEFNGSEQALREKIKRSLLIEALLKAEVERKSIVSAAELKAYYDKNPARFQYPESYAFQTITILPPDKATPTQLKEARKRADDALPQAKTAKTDETFGMLAEKISEDDYRVMMGFHKAIDRAKLPPIVVQKLATMKPGDISDVIQVEQAYTILRLVRHIPAGKASFQDVKAGLQKELEKRKTNEVRAAFDKKLRQTAKVEVL
jgi:peptidyl-prolyl cis-trans isomerase SurA